MMTEWNPHAIAEQALSRNMRLIQHPDGQPLTIEEYGFFRMLMAKGVEEGFKIATMAMKGLFYEHCKRSGCVDETPNDEECSNCSRRKHPEYDICPADLQQIIEGLKPQNMVDKQKTILESMDPVEDSTYYQSASYHHQRGDEDLFKELLEQGDIGLVNLANE